MTEWKDPRPFWHRLLLASNLMDYVNNRRSHISSPQLPPDSTCELLPSPTFRTDYAHYIWGIMSETPSLQRVATIALEDAERHLFDKLPSVITDDNKRLGNDGFSKLAKTNLMRHTYHVLFIASRMKHRAGGSYPTLLLLCLLHDFGKHPAIRMQFRSEKYHLHEEVSALYASYVLKTAGGFEEEYIDAMRKIITTHHVEPMKGVLACSLLNEADQRAREYEKGMSYGSLLA